MENTIRKINQKINGIATPEIPLIPEAVTGVKEPLILLNNRGGEGKWEFWEKPVADIPALDAADLNYDFSRLGEEGWAPVIVSGELEMQGFELANNTEYYYRRELYIPEDFAGCKCMLRFDGVYGSARVWIDGRYVRSHTGGFTTWYCDITEYALPGRRVKLVVGIADLEGSHPGLYNDGKQRPLRDPSGASHYAHHNIGGILRDVSLMALPGTYLARFHTDVEFDEEFCDARLQLGIQVNSESRDISVKYVLRDAEERVCLEKEMTVSGAGYRKENVTALQVSEPKHWDAEHPYLYTLQIILQEGNQVQAVYREKIGFREICFAGKKGSGKNKVYVNGREIKLRGTCRHDVSFRFGRSTTAEEDWAEIRAYKAANINHVRTSHYPASRYFLEACDALGMYVEQENAASFQGDNGFTIYCAPEDFVGEFTEMVERDRNHPSLLIWSLGNESGFDATKGYRLECDYVREADKSRPVIFSYPFTVRSLPLPYDILSMHYVDVEAPMGLADIPVLHDEYMHISCYNLEEQRRDPNVSNFWGISIRKAWEKIFETDGALGGDLWGGIDDIFYLPENIREKWQSHSRGKAAGYGPWGCVLDVHRRLKPEAYLTKKAYSPVLIDEKKIIFQEKTILIPVKNRFDHTNLNELVMICRKEERVEWRSEITEDIPPHTSGILHLEGIGERDRQPVRIQFYKGEELIDEYVAEESCAVQKSGGQGASARAEIKVQETADELIVLAGESRFVFSKGMTQMLRGEYRGKALLQKGPHLVLTGLETGKWRKTGAGIQVIQKEDQVILTLAGVYTGVAEVCFTITIHADGQFSTRYLIQDVWSGKEVTELGIRYDLAPGAEKICWRRDGLYSCYPQDHIGRNSGVAYRKNTKAENCKYGTVPEWSWKDDMRDDFLYGPEEAENGIATRDFKAMKENIRHFAVHFADLEEYVEAVDINRQAAVRVALSIDGQGQEKAGLLILNRWGYPELGWGNYRKGSIHVQRGTYGDAVLRFREMK